MTEDLNRLKHIPVPQPTPEGRQRAIDAALLAFDTKQAEKTQAPAQGSTWGARLKSIVQRERGTWIMNSRLTYGLGTAAIALLLLPLGYQLYTSTALTPLGTPPVATPPVVEPVPTPPEPQVRKEAVVVQPTRPAVAPTGPMQTLAEPVNASPAAPMMPADNEVLADVDSSVGVTAGGAVPQTAEVDALAAEPEMARSEMRTAAPVAQQSVGGAVKSAPAALAAPKMRTAPVDPSGSVVMEAAPPVGAADMMVAAPPPPTGMVAMPAAAPAPTQPSGDQFTTFVESPVKVVAEQPVSTFSIDVDTASYSYVRNALQNGWVPEPDAVRIEELINYFSYDYPTPESAATPFLPTISLMPTPWNPGTQLMQIGIKGYVPPATEQKPANLVFLIDTSGSMDEPNKLPLLKRAFALLVDQLNPADTVSIVVYAGSAGVVLEPTRAVEKARILGALEMLSAGGSTAGAEGIELAYRMAEQAKIADGTNRVILATDGDFNVGIEDPEELKTYIKEKRETGVFLSVLGFGQGNLGDDTMQALAQNGNGNAAYIDSFREAQKVLVEQVGGTLETIAKDVKIQVEFNPAFISEYRLIGYETRALNREDFNNDRVDAGDVGAGTTVTALYEITPVGSAGNLVDPLRYSTPEQAAAPVPASGAPTDELGFLKLRYKLPNEDTSKLLELPITRSLAVQNVGAAGEDQRFAAAVAAFGQKLKGSNYGGMRWDDIRNLAQAARGSDENGYRAEFVQLLGTAAVLQPDQACPAGSEGEGCR